MVMLTVAIGLFGLLELMNVAVLYVMPGSGKANGVGVFAAWERSKTDPELHQFVRYLVYWVAGTKLIFLSLLAVVLVLGSDQARVAAAAVLALSIAVFFWRMFPIARRMDAAGQMQPAGYSRILGVMIGVMVAVFAIAAVMAAQGASA
jgi:formate-dependent nitrite reductase membrane component NrfD